MRDDVLKEIRNSFLTEAEELLITVEGLLISLSKSEVDKKSTLDRLKRIAHNIKGSGKALGFTSLSTFNHAIENLLVALGADTIPLTPDRIQLLLECNDTLRADVATLRANPQAVLQHDDLLTNLEAAVVPQSRELLIQVPAGNNGATSILIGKVASAPEAVKVDISVNAPPSSRIETASPIQEAPSRLIGAASTNRDMTGRMIGIPSGEQSASSSAIESNAPGQSPRAIAGDLQSSRRSGNSPTPSPFGRMVGVSSSATQNDAQQALKTKPIGTDSDESIRVPMKKIDDILNAFGEQMIHLSALDHYALNLEKNSDEVLRTLGTLKKLAFDLQRTTMTLRMVTLKNLFTKVERAVRDTASMTGKNVQTKILGADCELDKIIVDQLSDSLIHMVRNAVDHGVESPEERAALGKPREAIITLTARREGGSLFIEVRDDGCGMDIEKIRKKGIEKGLISESALLSDQKVLELIFENGFSTKDSLSEISGRGVGMDVVKEMITSLKGTYEIDTVLGRGTAFHIRLPLSLSLFNGMVVLINNERYIVPCSQVSEIIEMNAMAARVLENGNQVVQLRKSIVPLFDLKKIFEYSGQEDKKSTLTSARPSILINKGSQNRYGFIVDRIVAIQRIVQKPLSPEMAQCRGAVGVTILGDGSPAIILDLRLLQSKLAKVENVKEMENPLSA